MRKPKKILFAPLDWGLGHATRCMPLIKEYLNSGCEVIIAGNDSTNTLLKVEFPDLVYLELRGYSIRYSTKKWKLPFLMITQLPKLISIIKYEHWWLQKVIDEYQIDKVISDNRYGLYSSKIPCVFITHQLNIQIPQSKFIQRMVNQINHSYIKKFSQCWIPDYDGENMSGELSHRLQLPNVQYLGNLSRFSIPEKQHPEYDLLLLLSGPEPQRSLLEEKLLVELKDTTLRVLIVRGIPLDKAQLQSNNLISIVNHLPAHELQTAILKSNIIICRSGYSTIMDLIKLNRHAILIPTPGQTEQEYLAAYLKNKKWFLSCEQKDISFDKLCKQYSSFTFSKFPDWDLELYKKKVIG